MNQQLPAEIGNTAALMDRVIVKGDLAVLDPKQRVEYYNALCQSTGLNPLARPFEYLVLNGKTVLYARKDATDQLRKKWGVSVTDMKQEVTDGVLVVTVKVQDAQGRTDIAKGALTIGNLKGDALANAYMKAETKAKRRATLSICGLGMLDEVELETIPGAAEQQIEQWGERRGAELIKAATTAPHIEEPPHTELWTDDEITPPEWSDKWDALGPVKQAGVLCKDPSFWKFIGAQSDVDAASVVRLRCGVSTRAELAKNAKAAKIWREYVADYRAWQREPEFVDEVSPPVSPPAAEAAGPASPSAPHALAGPAVPSAQEYVTQWQTIMEAATNADQLAKTWNEQKDLRDRIEWPAPAMFNQLARRVKQAIESMRAPA